MSCRGPSAGLWILILTNTGEESRSRSGAKENCKLGLKKDTEEGEHTARREDTDSKYRKRKQAGASQNRDYQNKTPGLRHADVTKSHPEDTKSQGGVGQGDHKPAALWARDPGAVSCFHLFL